VPLTINEIMHWQPCGKSSASSRVANAPLRTSLLLATCLSVLSPGKVFAQCTTTGNSVVCSGTTGNTTDSQSTNPSALIGTGLNSPISSVTVDAGATASYYRTVISIGSGTAGSKNTITINGSILSGGHNQGPDRIGGNAVEFGSYTNLTINKDGKIVVESTGEGDSEAINPTGYGNTITNYGLIQTNSNTDAIWLQGSDTIIDGNNVNTVDNYGTITAGANGNGSIIGNTDTSVVNFTNEAGATVNGNIALGQLANTVTFYSGSTVNGNVNGGGSLATLNLTGNSGTDSLAGTVSGFGTLNKDGGSTWLVGSATAPLTNLSSTLAVNVNAGTLILAGDTSTKNANVSINQGGTLQLGTGGTSGWIDGITYDNGTLVFDRSDTNSFTRNITGTGSVIQSGAGTTILTGTNTYTGGTTVAAGTLQLGDGVTNGSITGNVADSSTLAFDTADGTTVTYGGVVSGTGALTQNGAGTTILTGANTYTGGTTVAAGTLQAGATNTFSASSDYSVASGATLDLAGYSQTIAALTNAGTVSLVGSTPSTTLTVNGNYTGVSGSDLSLATYLADDGSATDKLAVIADTTGTSTLIIRPIAGSPGAQTNLGIDVIQVGGTSAGTFTLGSVLQAGAYQYVLKQGGNGGNAGDWYLVSSYLETPATPTSPAASATPTSPAASGTPTSPAASGTPTSPAASATPTSPAASGTPTSPAASGTPARTLPIYRAGVADYVSGQALNAEEGFWEMSTFHQRKGDERATDAEGRQTWVRPFYYGLQGQGATRFGYSDAQIAGVQAGQDLWADRNEENTTSRVALTLDYASVYSNFSDRYRPLFGLNAKTGSIKGNSVSLGLTYTRMDASGAYLDLVGKASILRNKFLVTDTGTTYQNGVRGALSAEVGKPFGIYEGWKIEPQGQAIYMHTEYSSFSDSVSSISGYGADALRGRLGARVYDETLPARTGGLQLYAVADVLHDFLMPTALTIGDTRVSEDYGRNWFDVGLGAQYPVALLKNAQLYGNALYRHAFDSAQTYGYQFDAGLKANF
jgi:outer membrane autotransporter protein